MNINPFLFRVIVVWFAVLLGVMIKLILPQTFIRVALIGWSLGGLFNLAKRHETRVLCSYLYFGCIIGCGVLMMVLHQIGLFRDKNICYQILLYGSFILKNFDILIICDGENSLCSLWILPAAVGDFLCVTSCLVRGSSNCLVSLIALFVKFPPPLWQEEGTSITNLCFPKIFIVTHHAFPVCYFTVHISTLLPNTPSLKGNAFFSLKLVFQSGVGSSSVQT